MESKCHISWESWKIKFFSALHLLLTFGGAFFSHASPSYASQTTGSLLQPICSAAAYSGFTQHLRVFQEPPKAGRSWVCPVKGMKDNRQFEFCCPKLSLGRPMGDRLGSL